MRILLVNPKFPETYWSFRHALPFEGKRSVFPPLGLLTVSSLLPHDCERRLIDLEVERLKDSHIEWADMIFITGMLAQKESLHEIVQRGKQRGKLIVLGGHTSPARSRIFLTPITSFRARLKPRCHNSSPISNAGKLNASTKLPSDRPYPSRLCQTLVS